MSKKIYYDDDARTRVLEGAKRVYEAVKVTMGPKGRNAVLGQPYGGPKITHDGVTVAKSIEITDDAENEDELGYGVGAELIKSAASKTADNVGDGTTTSTVLAYHILKEANKLITSGHNPMDLKVGLDAAAAEVLKGLKEITEPVENNPDRIKQVATVSSGDPVIGQMIADVIEAVGKDGSVTVEQSQTMETEKEIVDGFQIDRGYLSPYMVTDTNRMEAVFEKPLILITDKAISGIQMILPALEKLAASGKKHLIIIADSVAPEAIHPLVVNKLKGNFHTVAIQAPSFGERRRAILDDIAALTGAKVVSDETGVKFEDMTLEDFGSAHKVIVSKDSTNIIQGDGEAPAVQERIDALRVQIDATDAGYAKDALFGRLNALEGKVAIIRVGGATETEISEKKDRVDDAVAATKAAVAEGIVPGGGVTLVNLSAKLKVTVQSAVDSNQAGALLLKRALAQPFRELMTNAGINADEKLPQIVTGLPGYGFDVNNPDELINMIAAGIVDPAKVTREAITNAVSIAGAAMTMGCLVVDLPQAQMVLPEQFMQ